MVKIIFNFPKKYKRQLEKIIGALNTESEKRITISSLISQMLIKEFKLSDEESYKETIMSYIKSQESNS